MRHEFTAIIERDEKWFVGWCPEVPGANGQGLTQQECRENLATAVELILEDRLQDGLRGAPPDGGQVDTPSGKVRSIEVPEASAREPFVIKPWAMDLPKEWTSHKVEDLLDILEGADRR